MTNRHIRVASGIARIGVFVGLIAGTATPAAGQVLYGGMTGTVTDSTGANVPGASVTITHKETNFSREAVSTATGMYTFTNVQPGAYDVKVSLQGFREFVKTDVPVSVNQISRVDVRLDIGALTETITVQSAAELLQTDKADVHTELKSAEITSLPLNQFRNYQALVNLVPGATPGVFQNAETDTPTRSLSTNVNGQNRNNNGTRTDGATNLNIWLPHHNVYVSPAETIDTVNISTNNFDAEQGMAGGAAITVITKSGTNQFRGSAFEFYNSDKLNATPYFFGTDEAGRTSSRSAATSSAARLADRSCGTGCSSSHRSRATGRISGASTSSWCRMPRCARAISATHATPMDRCRPFTILRPATRTAAAGRPFLATSSPPIG